MLATAPVAAIAAATPSWKLPRTDEEKQIVSRVDSRRIALQGDMVQYRDRIDEVMRWINPPWDADNRRPDPRPELASAARQGVPVLHANQVGPTVTRWAALQAGAAPIFRVKPRHVSPPIDTGDQNALQQGRKQYDIDRAQAQDQSTQMENQTQEWFELNNFHRTLLWAAWSKEAFGKAILKTGWDDFEQIPTAELLENPSQVYYAWTNRYGRRQLAWAIVADQMDPAEANARFGLDMPTDQYGMVDSAGWLGLVDGSSDVDQRPEQSQALQRMIWANEYWELIRDRDPITQARRTRVMYALVVAGRVIDGPYYYDWMKRLPFHVIENEHILTYLHGKSTAEDMISLNAAYDDMLDRTAQVIDFEAGPRYKGINMANAGDEVDIPEPFNLIPLREGEDIQQIDTHVDFFPMSIHAEELRQARYTTTGLTPIAWGMSPNAQTSGRAMAAEWRAVELPLAGRLINMTPEIKDMCACWWDYGEHFNKSLAKLSLGGKNERDRYWTGRPYRRFDVLWEPLDIRDQSERTNDVVTRYTADLIGPESALDMLGVPNVDEQIAEIESYMLNPVWKPLRYQQYLTLQQMQLQIQQQAMQLQQPQAAPGAPGTPTPGETQAAGANAAAQGAQGPAPGNESTNQPGQIPLPVASQLRSMGAPAGGASDRTVVALGAPPTAGQAPR